jgi:glycosyltransferase involved in cell wall biosynthesis
MSRASMVWPRSLARQIRAIDPDVVHSHTGVWYKATLAARLAEVPRVVHTEHGRPNPDRLKGRLIDRLGAGRCDVVVAVSAPLALHLARALAIPRRKLVVIPNGVDTQTYQPRADTGRLRAELGLPAQTPVIGSIGRLEPIKAYDVMVEAFATLRARGKCDAVLVIAGEGSERPRLERLVRERNLERRVFLPGWRDDVHDMHSAFSLFTMSSTSEGTSISLLEAMSAGLAPAVTNVGGNADVLGDELRDCLVPSGEPEALAVAWEDTLLNPERARDHRAAARRRVVESFGLESMVRAYEDVYLRASREREISAQDRGVRGVPPSPRSSAEWPPVM